MAWDLATSKSKLETGPIYIPTLPPWYTNEYPDLNFEWGTGDFYLPTLPPFYIDNFLLTVGKDFDFALPMGSGSGAELVEKYNSGVQNGLVIGLLLRK